MLIRAEGTGRLPWLATARWWAQYLQFSARAGYADSQWYWGLVQENGWMDHADPHEAWKWIYEAG